ncbi:MAG: hypothetical protein ACFCU6_04590, partial [Balneolaceae bacterium]
MIYKISVLFAAFTVLFSACNSSDNRRGKPLQKAEVFLQDYPGLYQAVLSRDSDALSDFLNHENEYVRSTAWRALAKTPFENPGDFVHLAKEQDTDEAWFAVSFHPAEPGYLRELEELWTNGDLQTGPVCRYFSVHGDRQTIDILMNEPLKLHSEKECAFAIGKILTREKIREIEMQGIIKLALASDSEEIRKRILYGFYRSGLNTYTENSGYSFFALQEWITAGRGEQAGTDQYMVRILGEDGLLAVSSAWPLEKLQEEPQLAVEMARVFYRVDHYRNEHHDILMKLLNHKNPHVVIQTLDALITVEGIPDTILFFVENEFTRKTRNAEIFISSLNLLTKNEISPAPYIRRLENFMERNVYLTERALPIFRDIDTLPQHIIRIQNLVERGGVAGRHAIRTLHNLWTGLRADEAMRNRFRAIIRTVFEIKDRSMTYAAEPLLMDESLFQDRDFELLKKNMTGYSLPEDIEVYQMFARVLSNRFREQSAGLVDSLASAGYPPLNRTLSELGWNVEMTGESQSFREPDWKQLYEMGTRPYWILETEKGKIEIKLDPFSAPATVSAV